MQDLPDPLGPAAPRHSGTTAGMPGWFKALGVFALILAALFVLLHITGNGLGGHGHGGAGR